MSVRDAAGFAEADIIPELQPYFRFGTQQIFCQMRELAKAYKEDRVAVMVCGPPGVITDVRSLSSKHSENGGLQL